MQKVINRMHKTSHILAYFKIFNKNQKIDFFSANKICFNIEINK